MRVFSKCRLAWTAIALITFPSCGMALERPYSSNAATVNASGTVAVTNTFQSVFVAQPRAACKIQNNGTHVMYVFFGPIASATTATAVQLGTVGTVTSSISCGENGVVRADQVSITGTAADVFYADQQL